MRHSIRKRASVGAPDGTRRAGLRRVVLPALALAAALLLGASSAQAGDNYFERGFEGELGRIAAHEAVYLGKRILGGIVYPGYGYPPPYAVPWGYYAHRPGPRCDGPPYGRAVGHWKHKRRHAPCDCGRYEHYEEYRRGPAGYEHYEEYRRGPAGYERYEQRYESHRGYGYYD